MRASLYVCMCVCVYVCMYIRLRTCRPQLTWQHDRWTVVYMYVCMYCVCMHACIYVYVHAGHNQRDSMTGGLWYVCMYTCMYFVFMHVSMYVCIYASHAITLPAGCGLHGRTRSHNRIESMMDSIVRVFLLLGLHTLWLEGKFPGKAYNPLITRFEGFITGRVGSGRGAC